jgi:AraC-like DNA-binding protein
MLRRSGHDVRAWSAIRRQSLLQRSGDDGDLPARAAERDSDKPLSALAASVGYTSEFAVANAFKRQYGTAPGRYRRAEAIAGTAGGG